MSRIERLVFGVFLLTLGTFLVLGNVGLIDALGALRKAWPALFVLWGALELVNARTKEAVK
jgi:hypothetical protein